MVVRAPVGLALAVAAAVLAGTGCSSLERSGYQFVRSPSTGTYLKVPADWKVHDHRTVTRSVAESGQASADFEASFPFVTTFGAADDLAVHPFDPTGRVPAGTVWVRRLSDQERDELSLARLREELGPLNEGIRTGQIEPIDLQTFDRGEGVRGERIVYSFGQPGTDDRYVVDQTSLVDGATSRVYFLAVGCRADCYDDHEDQIDEIVTSLTIKER